MNLHESPDVMAKEVSQVHLELSWFGLISSCCGPKKYCRLNSLFSSFFYPFSNIMKRLSILCVHTVVLNDVKCTVDG